MKMFSIVLFVLAAVSASADDAQVKSTAAKLSPKELAAKRQEFMLKQSGGWVLRKATEPGICFALDGVDAKHLEFIVGDMMRFFQKSFYIRQERIDSVEALRKAIATGRDRVIVAVCSVPGQPSLTALPDERCALVNLDFLTKDNPSEEVLKKRLVKQCQRAFGFVGGASWTADAECVMKPAATIAQLDAISGTILGRSAFPGLYSYMDELKCAPGGKCTYKKACFEGWAPAPTNEYQRAIYEGVKNGTIKPGDKPVLPPLK